MKFILDFSKCKLSEVLNELPDADKKLPLKPGVIKKDFDLIECEVPKHVYAAFVKAKGGVSESVPFGMDITSIPLGAVLTRIE